MHKKTIVFLLLILFTFSAACSSTENTDEPVVINLEDEPVAINLENDLDKFSYALGFQTGTQLKQNGFEVNMEPFQQAIIDQINGNEAQMTTEDMSQIMQTMTQKFAMEKSAEGNEGAQNNLAAAQAFLAENASKEGVVTLASGLQYKVLQEGTGKSPTRENKVQTHYRGTFIDGTEFDSSYKRGQPAEFAVGGVIAGWTEALQLMKEGSKWQLFVSPELGYGAADRRTIPPNSFLIFEVELVKVLD